VNEKVTACRDAIQADQLAKLNKLLEKVRPHNLFYETKFNTYGIKNSFSSLESFYEECPFTTKEELVKDQRTNQPYGTNLSVPLEHFNRIHQTSGSTGKPLRWLDTQQSWQSMLDSWKTVFHTAGVTQKDRVLFPFSFGPFIGFWLAYEAAGQIGCLSFPGGGLTSVTRLNILLENEITTLCCTPTYALRLTEVAHEEGIDLSQSQLKTIIVAGEPGGSIASTRNRIESVWPNANVFDHHGMTEVGPVTHQCLEIPDSLQVMEDAYLAEILLPGANKPVAQDEEGELVLTTLTRTAMPLIRYRTGDLVHPQIYGEKLILKSGILGRTDDMTIVRGVNVYPSIFERILRDFDEVTEYQVIVSNQGNLTELLLKLEPIPNTNEESLREMVGKQIRNQLNLRVNVEITAPDTLPRFELKAKRWIQE